MGFKDIKESRLISKQVLAENHKNLNETDSENKEKFCQVLYFKTLPTIQDSASLLCSIILIPQQK